MARFALVAGLVLMFACSPEPRMGGADNVGGGAGTSGGAGGSGKGGAKSGGSSGHGGSGAGGAMAMGGAAMGGMIGMGGAAMGGVIGMGGAAMGGMIGMGGAAMGGMIGMGGAAMGGTPGMGGAAMGGMIGMGGAAMGGTPGMGGAAGRGGSGGGMGGAAMGGAMGMGGAMVNVAPMGTAYRWYAMANATANATRVAAPALNDGNLVTEIDLSGSATDAANAWEAAGVVWANTRSLTKVTFMNGSFDAQFDGVFDANFGLQTSTDGATWVAAAGWNLAPAYPNNMATAGGATFAFTRAAGLAVMGVRVVGQVHSLGANMDSYYVRAIEVQAF